MIAVSLTASLSWKDLWILEKKTPRKKEACASKSCSYSRVPLHFRGKHKKEQSAVCFRIEAEREPANWDPRQDSLHIVWASFLSQASQGKMEVIFPIGSFFYLALFFGSHVKRKASQKPYEIIDEAALFPLHMLLSDKTSVEYVFSRKILKDSGALSN